MANKDFNPWTSLTSASSITEGIEFKSNYTKPKVFAPGTVGFDTVMGAQKLRDAFKALGEDTPFLTVLGSVHRGQSRTVLAHVWRPAAVGMLISDLPRHPVGLVRGAYTYMVDSQRRNGVAPAPKTLVEIVQVQGRASFRNKSDIATFGNIHKDALEQGRILGVLALPEWKP